jgi:hypothetical protein
MATAATLTDLSDAEVTHVGKAAMRLRAGLRVAGAGTLLAMLLLPVLPASQGHPGSAVAGIARMLPAAADRPEMQPADLNAAGFALPPAQPFIASYGDAASALRAETCLTEAIYYEGALEPESGQRAIAQVVLNRVRHPAYPDNVCGVVFEGQERSTGCQFTFTCDGSRARPPVPSLWARANRIAKAALGGAVASEVGLSTHYHADYVSPYWSATLDTSGQIGRHIFYRWKGAPGQPQAFTRQYSGREPLIGAWAARAPQPADAGGDKEGPALTLAALTDNAAPHTAPPAPPPPTPAPFRARPLPLAAKASAATEGGAP